MIPRFPTFKCLELRDRREIEHVTTRFAPYSDFNFLSLASYSVQGRFQVSTLENNLVVKFLDYITSEPFYSFLGDSQTLRTAHTLIAFAAAQGTTAKLRLIPEQTVAVISQHPGNDILATEDQDNFDYILPIQNLLDLRSRHLSKKRRSIESFRRTHPDCLFKSIDLSNPRVAASVLKVMSSWRTAKRKSQQDVAVEFEAIERCLHLAKEFRLISIGAYLAQELIGFTINEVVHGDCYMGHFGKASPTYKGLNDMLEQETAKVMQHQGCLWMNYQQDLGLKGLRVSKRSWQPSYYLKKYTLEAKQ